MEAIYWHRTGEQQEGDSAAALLETFEDESLSTCEAYSTSVAEPPAALPPLHQLQRLLSSTSSDTDTSTSQQRLITGKRKGGHRKLDLPSVLVEMQAEEEWSHAQHDENIWLLLSEARENEAALQREEMAQNTAFNQSFLGVLG